jgi:hypothetical protein
MDDRPNLDNEPKSSPSASIPFPLGATAIRFMLERAGQGELVGCGGLMMGSWIGDGPGAFLVDDQILLDKPFRPP